MAAAFVMAMIAAYMTGHQPLHVFIELICLLRLNEQMKMVRHKAPGVDSYCMFFPCMQHEFNKRAIVPVLMENLLSAVTAIDYMVKAVIR
jgi:hypothetical protein